MVKILTSALSERDVYCAFAVVFRKKNSTMAKRYSGLEKKSFVFRTVDF
ncbi:hypothetical protein [uncultured Marixanthomonas sp.]